MRLSYYSHISVVFGTNFDLRFIEQSYCLVAQFVAQGIRGISGYYDRYCNILDIAKLEQSISFCDLEKETEALFVRI